jgi:hypothetical protein
MGIPVLEVWICKPYLQPENNWIIGHTFLIRTINQPGVFDIIRGVRQSN